MVFPGIWQQARTENYLTARATVLECRVIETQGDDSTSYRPYFRYQYEVGGQTHINDRYRGGPNISAGRKWAREEVDAHPVGSNLEIWYSPDNPAESVVEKGLTGMDLFLPMFLTPFNLIGLALMLGPLVGSRRSDPGGVPLVREGLGWRARMKYSHPVVSALVTLGAASFFGVFIVGFASLMHPSLLTMQIAWAVAAGLSLRAGYRAMVENRTGAGDLRVEPGRLEFSSEGQRIACRADEVGDVLLRREEKRDSDGDLSYRYAVDVHLQSGVSHSLRVWNSEEEAQEFVDWLKGHLQLGA